MRLGDELPERRPLVIGVVAVTATLVVLNLLGFGFLRVAFPWMFSGQEASSSTTSGKDAADRAPVVGDPDALPARVVVDTVMATPGPPLVGEDGWVAAAPATGVPGVATGPGCAEDPAPAPVVAASRGWVMADGPLPEEVAAAVSITARAYGAGEGGDAFDTILARASSCSDDSADTGTGTGTSTGITTETDLPGDFVQSAVITTTSTSVVLWRRGDVVMSVTSQVGQRPGYVTAVRPLVDFYDAALATALDEQGCLDEDSPVADRARSPYADPDGFTGLEVQDTVQVVVPPRMPTPTELTTAAPVSVPGPYVEVPYLASLPVRPADPVWPPALPEPVERPVEPTAPTEPDYETTVPHRVDDQGGPGCGWAFAGQRAPRFDQKAADADAAAAAQAAGARMQQGLVDYQQQVATYYEQYAAFTKQAEAWRAYVGEVEDVRAAWARIQAERDDYDRLLAAYESALAERQDFNLRQRAARQDFEAKKDACRAASGDTTDPTTPQNCPPTRPEILDKPRPEVPPKPQPPGDPRPPGQR